MTSKIYRDPYDGVGALQDDYDYYVSLPIPPWMNHRMSLLSFARERAIIANLADLAKKTDETAKKRRKCIDEYIAIGGIWDLSCVPYTNT